MFHWFIRKRIIVEKASLDDADALAEIHAGAFKHNWSETDFDRFLDDERYGCLIAREENWITRKILGFVLFRHVENEAEIITIATRSNARRSGIGRQLMDAAMRWMQYERIDKLFLEVDEGNQAAIGLYNSLRFKKISERKGYYSGHALGAGKPSTALVMQRDLG